MKKLICVLMALMLLCAGSALAEARYLLPEGWGYTDSGKIYDPSGEEYDSIWDPWCLALLSVSNWGYGDKDYMDANWLLDENGNPANPDWETNPIYSHVDSGSWNSAASPASATTGDLGDESTLPALCALAVLTAAGLVIVDRKRRAC